jgi:hypothetical protein
VALVSFDELGFGPVERSLVALDVENIAFELGMQKIGKAVLKKRRDNTENYDSLQKILRFYELLRVMINYSELWQSS